MWPPTVGARVRPVISAPETVTPDGDPVPTPGAGPMWARLRYPAPSTGDDRLLATVADVEGLDGDGGDAAGVATASVVWEDGTEEDGVSLRALGPRVVASGRRTPREHHVQAPSNRAKVPGVGVTCLVRNVSSLFGCEL
mgnify:CR=1 FL=1